MISKVQPEDDHWTNGFADDAPHGPRPIGLERAAPAPDEPRVLPCPCPRCGGRMIVIEVFARGRQPSYRPTPIRIDTS